MNTDQCNTDHSNIYIYIDLDSTDRADVCGELKIAQPMSS